MKYNLFLTHEARVMVKIGEHSEKGDVIYFSKLKNMFDDSLSPITLTKCIRNLESAGLLELEWEQLEGEQAKKLGNRWIRRISVSGEAVELVKLLEKTQETLLNMSLKNR